MTALKMQTDARVAQMSDQLHGVTLSANKTRRERDTYKEMLDGAQKTIADLKLDSIRRDKSSKIVAEVQYLLNWFLLILSKLFTG